MGKLKLYFIDQDQDDTLEDLLLDYEYEKFMQAKMIIDNGYLSNVEFDNMDNHQLDIREQSIKNLTRAISLDQELNKNKV